MLSDTTQQVIASAFRVNPAGVLEFLSMLSEDMEHEARELDLTVDASDWAELSEKLLKLAARVGR